MTMLDTPTKMGPNDGITLFGVCLYQPPPSDTMATTAGGAMTTYRILLV